MSEHNDEKKVGYVFTLATSLGENQQLSINGNLALGATKEEMGQEFDKLLAVTSRLAAKHKIEKKKAEIAGDEAMIAAMTSDLDQLDKSTEGMQLKTAEKNNREAMVRNVRHLQSRVAGYRADLEGLIKEAE